MTSAAHRSFWRRRDFKAKAFKHLRSFPFQASYVLKAVSCIRPTNEVIKHLRKFMGRFGSAAIFLFIYNTLLRQLGRTIQLPVSFKQFIIFIQHVWLWKFVSPAWKCVIMTALRGFLGIALRTSCITLSMAYLLPVVSSSIIPFFPADRQFHIILNKTLSGF